MADENMIMHRVRAARVKLNKLFDNTGSSDRNRERRIVSPAHGFIDRARNAVGNAFRR